MIVAELLRGFEISQQLQGISVPHLASHTKDVRSGSMFFALDESYIDIALKQGAAIIVSESWVGDKGIIVPSVRHALAVATRHFYQAPDMQMKLIAITGTNGKTSVCHFLAQFLQLFGYKSSLIGTLGSGLYGETLSSTGLTTPSCLDFYQQLDNFRQEKADYVCLEASSHGLLQKRIDQAHLQGAILTNISRDHLDYHDSMASYIQAKKSLLTYEGIKWAVLPYEQNNSLGLLPNDADYPVLFFDIDQGDVYAQSLDLHQNIRMQVVTPLGKLEVESSLIGRHNALNLLATIAALVAEDISIAKIEEFISQIKVPCGRMQKVSDEPRVIVDYAHTPQAIAAAIDAIEGEVICVFGAGGDRDIGKRVLMGRAASQAEVVIITSDNPRTESPQRIAEQVAEGCCNQYQIELDRAKAIQLGLEQLQSEQTLLILGKGHENYQEHNGERIYFNDVAVVEGLLECR